MKLFQLNIWGGRLDLAPINLIKQHNPDIINLQEVYSSGSAGANPLNTREVIHEELSYPSDYYSPVMGCNFSKFYTDFGNLVLAKQPFRSTRTVFTEGAYNGNFVPGEDDYNIRCFQHVEIDLNGESLHVINYHGYHVHGNKNGNEKTFKHCQMIADYIATLTGKIVLSGDFNLAPGSESIAVLNKSLRNLISEFSVESTRNYLAKPASQPVPVDYIFVSNDVEVKHFEVSPEVVSDHAALILEFN